MINKRGIISMRLMEFNEKIAKVNRFNSTNYRL